mmetsp:Transcript_22661/g.31739  ORF Transcript_22661/g.31739 Transcript_22661/m.31739 type:complete len:198 (+) Transcript_22661:147-740(+)
MDFQSYMFQALIILCLGLSTSAEELTSVRLKQLVESGKNGMVKFCQDWCTKCARTQEDWDKLATLENDSVFIGNVDCGKERELCEEHGAERGCYAIQYWHNGAEHKYNGSQAYDSLARFIDSILSQKCQITSPDSTCSEKAKKYLEKWSPRGIADIKKEILRLKSLDSPDLTPELNNWVKERSRILGQIISNSKSEM